ncbi:MAG TPA: glycosyltransferase [Phycisphaerae bacterium]|nr:glycosyltransferase [Phycisphaerae bacterium]
MPVVSVLIPVFNAGRWLRESVESVRGQTVGDWELIAIDDGSTDDSGAVLAELAKGDGRMRVLSRDNRGLVATRNELLGMARGEFVAWIDSDDRMTPERLALQLERFSREPGLICLGGACTLTDPEGLPIRTHAFPTDHEPLVEIMREDIAFYFPSVTMRREAALKVGGFREPLRIGEDYDICLRMSEVGRVGNVPEVVLYYRQHMASTANAGRAKCAAYRGLVKELAAERRWRGTDRLQRGEKVDVDFGAMPGERDVRAETHRRWAWWALAEGHWRTSRKYALRALRDAPLDRKSWKLLACSIRGR